MIVESAVESTGASMGQLVHDGRVLIEVGEKLGPSQLEFPLGRARDVRPHSCCSARTSRPSSARARGLACRSRGDRACQRQAARTVEQQALVDGLTGLANRFCTAALEKELARAERFGEPLALVLIDIDDFKDINDRWGIPPATRFSRPSPKRCRPACARSTLPAAGAARSRAAASGHRPAGRARLG